MSMDYLEVYLINQVGSRGMLHNAWPVKPFGTNCDEGPSKIQNILDFDVESPVEDSKDHGHLVVDPECPHLAEAAKEGGKRSLMTCRY